VVGLSKTKKITNKITGDSREVNANKTNIEKKYRENIKKNTEKSNIEKKFDSRITQRAKSLFVYEYCCLLGNIIHNSLQAKTRQLKIN